MIDPNVNNDVSRLRRGERIDSMGRTKRDVNAPPFRPVLDDESHKERSVKEETEHADAPSIFDISREKSRTPLTQAKDPLSGKQNLPQEELLALANKHERIDTDAEKDIAPPIQEEDQNIHSDPSNAAAIQAGSQAGGSQAALNAQIAGRENQDQGSSDRKSNKNSSAQAIAEPPASPRDLIPSQVPPPVPIVEATSGNVGSNTSVAAVKSLEEVVQAVAEAITQMRAGDQTDTTVTLRNPPILAGAQLVLSQFGNASGQFNVAFYNLTQASQQFLDQMQARTQIEQLLKKNDYIMHMFITTTQAYEPIVRVDAENLADARRFSRDERGEGEQKKEQDG